MSFTDRNTGRGNGDGVPSTVSSIPLTDLDVGPDGQPTIGALVKNATSQVSTLVRAEVELAKAEVTGEIKKGLQGSVFFILALTVLLFSTFFLFFFFAELLDVWLPRWAAFLIVFGVQVLLAGALGFLGYLRVRKIRAPKKTIESVKEFASVLPSPGADAESGAARVDLPAAAAPSGRHSR
ncbi:phage holin family protein [Speluncibacter jeojiensis]|uniref:Phage holin family protein n=1 Tax=Speluncibacter jeojiensis TaxID=2710754 RepID=A0A9X4M805_9ACTN|nr:phage holin family protein [Rhodococcus sp. D2-41]MDG3016983.1 phage holin family protein [Corynebacteriales bacterium D3-21]